MLTGMVSKTDGVCLEVAVTLMVEARSSRSTVSFPAASIKVPELLFPPTDQVTSLLKLLLPCTSALNCMVLPAGTLAEPGEMTTFVTTGTAAVTLTVKVTLA